MTVQKFHAIHLRSLRGSTNELRARSTDVNFSVDPVDNFVRDLLDSFRASQISVGLAAIQIGIAKRIFVMNPNKETTNSEIIFINPQILSTSGDKVTSFESCMSVPDYRCPVTRKKKVEIHYKSIRGDDITSKFSGFEARIIQHEMDHLEGVLCFDHVESQDKIENFQFSNVENYPVGLTFVDA